MKSICWRELGKWLPEMDRHLKALDIHHVFQLVLAS